MLIIEWEMRKQEERGEETAEHVVAAVRKGGATEV